MQMILTVAFFAAVIAMLGTGSENHVDRMNQDAARLAMQMNWYHQQAVNQCMAPQTCTAGHITVTNMPSGASVPYSSMFQSGTDGTTVVTTWIPSAIKEAQAPESIGGLVAGALIDEGSGDPGTGMWNPSTETVGGDTSTLSVSVPQGFGGLNITGYAPILATKVR